jgi:peptidoglycan/LPS O-acetylase OafA/YrhL
LPTLLPLSDKHVLSDFASLWFPDQALSFIVGILTFHFLRAFQGLIPRMALQVLLSVTIMAAIGLPFFAAWHPKGIHWIFFNLLLMYSLNFGIGFFCLAQDVGRLLVNTPIRYIGRVSYSAYFWHFAVIELMGRIIDPSGAGLASQGYTYFLPTFVACAALTMLGATITFHLVEAPMIRLGHKLAAMTVNIS